MYSRFLIYLFFSFGLFAQGMQSDGYFSYSGITPLARGLNHAKGFRKI